jgi:hypothetical protein
MGALARTSGPWRRRQVSSTGRTPANFLNSGLPQREHAIVNVAMFEATNAITRRYHSYVLKLTAPPKASIEAAAATAAHHALVGGCAG